MNPVDILAWVLVTCYGASLGLAVLALWMRKGHPGDQRLAAAWAKVEFTALFAAILFSASLAATGISLL